MKIKRSVDLAPLTTFRIGGQAEQLYTVNRRQDLKQLWPRLLDEENPLFLGRGSNLLIPDHPIQRPVVRLSGDFTSLGFDETTMTAGAAVLMPELATAAARAGLTGLEWASGVPGSVGGAVVMNAGAYNQEVGDVLQWVELLLPTGDIERWKREELSMAYRHTDLPEGAVVTRAAFELERRDRSYVVQATRALVEKRRDDQPVGPPSAGCMFKNPNGDSAGRLIDESGMSGERVGGVEVASQHSNYFLNREDGTYEDVMRLMDNVRERVMDRFDVELEPEVHVVESK